MLLDQSIKSEAVRLRTQELQSLKEIAAKLNISKSTCSLWLKEYPIPPDVLKERYRNAGLASGGKKRTHKQASRKNAMILATSPLVSRIGKNAQWSSSQKGKIAEAAVVLRLAILGLDVYKSFFDGDKVDVVTQTGCQLQKIQVKWVSKGAYGEPMIKLRCSDGRGSTRRYKDGEFDFIVGYDLERDTCYVYTEGEVVQHNTCVSCSKEAEEAWNKLQASQAGLV